MPAGASSLYNIGDTIGDRLRLRLQGSQDLIENSGGIYALRALPAGSGDTERNAPPLR